jgi:FkbM family methyltransferase
MTFVSYAQNMEDVMLWRALKDIDQGFYIDVGANDPNQDSVTKAFYEHGWRGINVEPVSQWFEKLQSERPRDINLQIAAGAEQGELKFYEIPDTGLSTADKAIAERHEAERGYKKIKRTVRIETLTEICKTYHCSPIHFLKIDVEGAEKKVLEGIDLSKTRPWIIVVESTLPNTQIEDYEDWEPILVAGKYEYVYFDGLNRFYVAQEHPELLTAFKYPPNVFDEYVLHTQQQIEERAQQANERSQQAEAQVQQANERSQQAEAQVQQANERSQQAEAQAQQANERSQQAEAQVQQATSSLQAVYNSRSWQITAPLRAIGNIVKAMRPIPARILYKIKSSAKSCLAHTRLYVIARPKLKRIALTMLRRLPGVNERLRTAVTTNTISTSSTPTLANDLDQLTPHARQIFFDLKSAIENRQKENS